MTTSTEIVFDRMVFRNTDAHVGRHISVTPKTARTNISAMGAFD